MAEQIEVTYRAAGGRPPVDLDLHLGADGQAEVFVGSSYSIPLARVSRVGFFGGRAPAAEVETIHAYLGERDLLARGGGFGRAAPDVPGRFLELAVDGRRARLDLNGMTIDDEIERFEQLLQALALALTEQPVRAVEASLNLSRRGDQIAATIELRSVGSQPLTVLLVDPAEPGQALRARLDLEEKMALPSGASLPMAVGSTVLSPDAVRAMAEKGELPSGIAEVPPGMTYRFSLPPVAAPQSALPVSATGTVQFWLPEEQARRGVTVLTLETPLL